MQKERLKETLRFWARAAGPFRPTPKDHDACLYICRRRSAEGRRVESTPASVLTDRSKPFHPSLCSSLCAAVLTLQGVDWSKHEVGGTRNASRSVEIGRAK